MELPWGLTNTSGHLSLDVVDEGLKLSQPLKQPTRVVALQRSEPSKRTAGRRKPKRQRRRTTESGHSTKASTDVPQKPRSKSALVRCSSWGCLEVDVGSGHSKQLDAPEQPGVNSCWSKETLDKTGSNHSRSSWAGLDIFDDLDRDTNPLRLEDDDDEEEEESQSEREFGDSILLKLTSKLELAEQLVDTENTDETESDKSEGDGSGKWPDFDLDDLSDSDDEESDDEDSIFSDDSNSEKQEDLTNFSRDIEV